MEKWKDSVSGKQKDQSVEGLPWWEWLRLHSHYRGHGSNPWSRDYDPRGSEARPEKRRSVERQKNERKETGDV